jgi:hypothetical protein
MGRCWCLLQSKVKAIDVATEGGKRKKLVDWAR